MDWMNGVNFLNGGPQISTAKHEQQKVVRKLETFLNILRSVQLKNVESLIDISENVDHLLSSLKYYPTEPAIDILPVEITTDILNFLCDSGAFLAASVCQEWKEILLPRLKDLEEVRIGKHCLSCEDSECFKPDQMLKASATLNLDIPLTVCHPITDVDSNVVTEALSSISALKIQAGCVCFADEYKLLANMMKMEYKPILDYKHLFEMLQKKGVILASLELKFLDLTHLDQEALIKYLLTRVKKLTLIESYYSDFIDFDIFVEKLLQKSKDSELVTLNLENIYISTDNSVEDQSLFQYPSRDNFERPGDFYFNLADALCQVESVRFKPVNPIPVLTTMRLVQNILTKNIKTKALAIESAIDLSNFVYPQDLRIMFDKMQVLDLRGVFSWDQVGEVITLPGVVTEQAVSQHGSGILRIAKGLT